MNNRDHLCLLIHNTSLRFLGTLLMNTRLKCCLGLILEQSVGCMHKFSIHRKGYITNVNLHCEGSFAHWRSEAAFMHRVFFVIKPTFYAKICQCVTDSGVYAHCCLVQISLTAGAISQPERSRKAWDGGAERSGRWTNTYHWSGSIMWDQLCSTVGAMKCVNSFSQLLEWARVCWVLRTIKWARTGTFNRIAFIWHHHACCNTPYW